VDKAKRVVLKKGSFTCVFLASTIPPPMMSEMRGRLQREAIMTGFKRMLVLNMQKTL
jgi:hypothetical protein